jgi:hypothetical protein
LISACNCCNPQLIHHNSQLIQAHFQINFSHIPLNPVLRLISGKNSPVEKIKTEKFGNQVGKSVILCQFKKI